MINIKCLAFIRLVYTHSYCLVTRRQDGLVGGGMMVSLFRGWRT